MDFGVLVDVCLGVLSLMILFTLAAAAINEMIADNILNMRGKSLYEAVRGLLKKYLKVGLRIKEDPEKADLDAAVDNFYEDPAIVALMEKRSQPKLFFKDWASVKGDFRPPSAIEPQIFAGVAKKIIGESLAKKEGAMSLDKIAEDIGSFEKDFELTNDRVSGWYVRKVKTSLFIIGLILAVGANVDLFGYARQLAHDNDLKTRTDATVAMINALEAQRGEQGDPASVTQPAADELLKTVKKLEADLNKADLAVGWECPVADKDTTKFCAFEFSRIPGWLIIAFGVTLGAQFWFDLFRSLVNLRTPGKTGGTVEALSSTNTPRDPGPGAAGARI